MSIDELKALLSTATGKEYGELRPDQTLTELGLESIDRVRLVVRLEQRLGREIDEASAMSLRTVNDLLTLATAEPPS